ncbi:SDCG8-like protein [Mya arenaria]|uniref:SDCG8-like protein n=1 Tax=Mya arenaria TaxID=6604 RepID=A0ABY7FFS9_MYAAR|nr:SDCG8-like protein [Mya arenaria]
MYAYEETRDGAESYQRTVRERANASLHDLEDVLTGSPNATLNTSTRAKEQLATAVHPRHLRWYEAEARPQKYRDAVTSLQHILKDTETQASTPSPVKPPSLPRGPLPGPEETASLLQQQAAYIQQIESENQYMKDEFASVRIKIRDVIEENHRLHEALKHSVMEEIGDDMELNKVGSVPEKFGELNISISQGGGRQWQHELEKLTALHNAKTDRLEIQLNHTREEVVKYEQLVEDLRAQLRLRDAVPTHEDGLGDIYLSESQRGHHTVVIDRLTRERNDLLEVIAGLKHKVTDMAQREDEAYQQMKKGIELVEQAQLEQTQALVQREQLAEELNNMKGRYDNHVMTTQQRIAEEREATRKEGKVLVDELNTKIRELTEQFASAQLEMEKALRDKVEIINQLETAKLEIRRYDKELSLATENFSAESTNSKIQKSHAVNEASRLRTELDSVRREKDQDRDRMLSELDDFRRRLNKAERELVNSKEECIHLTANTQALERELHLAKLARDSVERGRTDDLKRSIFLCDRHETGKLRRHNEELKNRLHRTIARLKDLEDQVEQHSRVEEKLTERLKMMDEHAQHQGGQNL